MLSKAPEMDLMGLNEQLKNKRLLHVGALIDSERGVHELHLQFEDGYHVEVFPDGFGLRVSGGQEYVGPRRP